MNFQQLKIIHETMHRNFNLTEVSNGLYTSQSGVSKHIKDLEDELGVEIYIRKGKRLLGFTEVGKEMVHIVERILQEIANLKNLADEYSAQDSGELCIATTHTQARYTLPSVISQFRPLYPNVHLKLYQASPSEIVQLLQNSEVDIGIATEALGQVPEFATFPFYAWRHTVVVPKGHPLAKVQRPSLQQLSEYPIITYHEGITGRARVEEAFQHAGIAPNIVMSALDSDVIKSYVELDLGIGIITPIAFNAERDDHLINLDTAHLFADSTTTIALKKRKMIRKYVYQFMRLCVPSLSQSQIDQQLELRL